MLADLVMAGAMGPIYVEGRRGWDGKDKKGDELVENGLPGDGEERA